MDPYILFHGICIFITEILFKVETIFDYLNYKQASIDRG